MKLQDRILAAKNWQEQAYEQDLDRFVAFKKRFGQEVERKAQYIQTVKGKNQTPDQKYVEELATDQGRYSRVEEVLVYFRLFQSHTIQAVRPLNSAVWGLWENYALDVITLWGTVQKLIQAEKEEWEHKEYAKVAEDCIRRMNAYVDHIAYLKKEGIL